MDTILPRVASTIAAAYNKQRMFPGTHFDSQRARNRNKSLITLPAYTRESIGTITRTEPDEVYFSTDSTTQLRDAPRNIPEQVCAATQRLPPATASLKTSGEDMVGTNVYQSCSMNEIYEPPRVQTRSHSLKAGGTSVTEHPRRRIGDARSTLFDSTGLDIWVKNSAHTRQIGHWEQQNDLCCSNKHLPHACFPREYARLMGYMKISPEALLSHEWAKVKALEQVNAEHRDVLTRMEQARSKGIHGFADTRIPRQLEALRDMQTDASIPLRDAYYYYGFHPLPVEGIEEQYRLRAATASEAARSSGVFLWGNQKLRL